MSSANFLRRRCTLADPWADPVDYAVCCSPAARLALSSVYDDGDDADDDVPPWNWNGGFCCPYPYRGNSFVWKRDTETPVSASRGW